MINVTANRSTAVLNPKFRRRQRNGPATNWPADVASDNNSSVVLGADAMVNVTVAGQHF